MRSVAVVLAVMATSVTSAYGYWTATATSGSGTATVGTLNPPTAVTVTNSAYLENTISWTASSTSGGGVAPQGYYVKRYGTSTYVCGNPTTPTLVTSPCVDSGRTAGTSYQYTVVAVYKSWTASADSSSVAMVGASQLVFTTQPSDGTTNTALTTQPVVTVRDANGHTATDSLASITLTLTQGGATLTCTTNPVPASSGVATFAGCAVNTAGTYTLTASATDLTSATSSSFTIT